MNNASKIRVVNTSSSPTFILEGYKFHQKTPLKAVSGDLDILVPTELDGAQKLQILYLLVGLMQLFQEAPVEAPFDDSFFQTLSRLKEVTEYAEFLRLKLKL
jgi:hypothetical protein